MVEGQRCIAHSTDKIAVSKRSATHITHTPRVQNTTEIGRVIAAVFVLIERGTHVFECVAHSASSHRAGLPKAGDIGSIMHTLLLCPTEENSWLCVHGQSSVGTNMRIASTDRAGKLRDGGTHVYRPPTTESILKYVHVTTLEPNRNVIQSRLEPAGN